jgi:hypothetical protein
MGAYTVVNPGSLIAGQPEDISVVLANFQALATVLNGGIDNSNVNVAAAIAISKLQGYPTDGTKYLAGDSTWKVISAGPGVPVTTLPASPTDGQQALLTDSVTVPTYSWLMQWNASLSRWTFIGGADWIGSVDTDENRSGTGTFGDLATVGPTFTTPRAGTYQIAWSAETYINAVAMNYVGININGVLPVTTSNTSISIPHRATSEQATGTVSPRTFAGIGAAQVIKMQYQDGGGSSNFRIRKMSLRPVFLT